MGADHVKGLLEESEYRRNYKDSMALGLKEKLENANEENQVINRVRKQEIDLLTLDRDRVKGLLKESECRSQNAEVLHELSDLKLWMQRSRPNSWVNKSRNRPLRSETRPTRSKLRLRRSRV